jgi:D-alanyl-D-alanine carboxypeptidase/D-alanyl-D-alanine-endopeptidase (penicillin-binding protein 4)
MRLPRPALPRTCPRPGAHLGLSLVAGALGLGLTAHAVAQSAATSPDPTRWPAPLAAAWPATGLPAQSLSVWVQPVGADQPRVALAADTPRRMASVMKLVSTGVALQRLGPAFSWQTPVGLGGPLGADGELQGPLHLRASGDPSWDAMRLREAMAQWREQGLRRIRGDVVIDRSVWRLPPHDPAAFDNAPLKPYNAGADAWLLAHGAVTLRFELEGTTQPRVRLSPPLQGVTVDNQTRLSDGPCGAWREGLRVEASGEGLTRRLTVQGRYPTACLAQNWPIRWPSSPATEHSARLFASTWQALGGQLDGVVREGPWPAGLPTWATWASPPLHEVVRDINKFSNNVMARQLFLTLASEGAASTDSLSAARTLAAQHVLQRTRQPDGHSPCEGEHLVLDNGAGLSRTEGASARCMGRWLQALWQSPQMPEWLASLPIAGLDGTARRMTGAIGQAHLKTGSLDDVVSLAGVVDTAQGQRYLVVAVVNDPKAEKARPALQALLQWISQDTP